MSLKLPRKTLFVFISAIILGKIENQNKLVHQSFINFYTLKGIHRTDIASWMISMVSALGGSPYRSQALLTKISKFSLLISGRTRLGHSTMVKFFYKICWFNWLRSQIWVLSQHETIITVVSPFGKTEQFHKTTTFFTQDHF